MAALAAAFVDTDGWLFAALGFFRVVFISMFSHPALWHKVIANE